MRCKPPDKRFYAELKDLNMAFLTLITDQTLFWQGSLFGLDPGVTAGLRALSEAELEFIAATPCPLAGFANLPSPNIVADSPAELRPDQDRWRESANLFATELLMYLWHTAKHDRLAATLCLGPATGRVGQLAGMGFREICDYAAVAAHALQASLSRHPRFWPDLIRAARSGDPDFRLLSRLAVIPLLLAESSRGRYR